MVKKVSLLLLCGVQHSVIIADFLMLEAQQPITVDYLLILLCEGSFMNIFQIKQV